MNDGESAIFRGEVLAPGESLGRYRVVRELGRGGMGVVYLAEDTMLGRTVALKVVVEDGDPSAGDTERVTSGVTRLLREARASAQLSHNNIVAVHDVGVIEGRAFIAMERVEGRLLSDFVGDDTVGLRAKLRWLLEIAEALAAAHAKGLIHRDVKPDNVMITTDGQAKVFDFGIARREDVLGEMAAAGLEHADTMTAKGTIVGTPAYMSPEQLRGDQVDPATDQFSWGVLAYQLLSGSLPWSTRDVLATITAIVEQPVESIGTCTPGLPEGIAAAIDRTLAKEATSRWPSMRDLAEQLRTVENAGATRERPRGRAKQTVRRRQPLALVLGMLLLGVAGLGSWAALSSDPVTVEPTPDELPAAIRSMLDLPDPPCSEDALLPYRSGIRATRNGNYAQAFLFFSEANTADPSCGATWYRLIATGRGRLSAYRLREVYEAAQRNRDQLIPRDQVILDAYAPLIANSPPDRLMFARRYSEVASKFPEDAEIQSKAAFFCIHEDYETRLKYARRAIKSDPGHADGHQAIAWIHAQRDDIAAARAAAVACVEEIPAATDCIKTRLWLEAELGECETMQEAAQQWIARSPRTSRGYQMLAHSLAAQLQPRATVEEALRQRWARLPDIDREAIKLIEATQLAVLYGEFEEARATLKLAEETLAGSTNREPHAQVALLRAELAYETGDVATANAVINDFVAREPVWIESMVSESESDGAFHHAPRLSVILRSNGAPEADWRGLVDRWRQRQDGANLTNAWSRWALGDALLATDASTAEAALARVPEPLVRGQVHLFNLAGRSSAASAATGRALALAGRTAEAREFLQVAAGTCTVLTDPFMSMRARVWLAETVASEQPAEACELLTPITREWGRRKGLTTRTGARAEQLSGELRCSD